MFAFVAQLFAVDLVATHLVVEWLCMKITGGVDKEFAAEIEAELVVLGVVVVDEVDGVDESDRIDKHRGIALS